MSGTHLHHHDYVERQLERLTGELADRFRGVLGESTVYRYVIETYTLLSRQATVRSHLMNLTAHFVAQRLTDGARAHGHISPTAPQVLFVCVHDIGRSQIAAALLAHNARGRIVVRSAGSAPTETVHTALDEWATAWPRPIPSR